MDRKMRVTSGPWDIEKLILRDRVLEGRHVSYLRKLGNTSPKTGIDCCSDESAWHSAGMRWSMSAREGKFFLK
jgi:hypothetical protein